MALYGVGREPQVAEPEKSTAVENDVIEAGFERRTQFLANNGIVDVGDGILVLTVKPEHRIGIKAVWFQIRSHMRVEIAVEAILNEAKMANRDVGRQIVA